MSLLSPSSSLWAARQPGEATRSGPSAGRPARDHQEGPHHPVSTPSCRSPSGFLLGTGERPLPQQQAGLGLHSHAFGRCWGGKGWDARTCVCCQSRWPRWPNLGPPEPEGCGTVVPELWGQGCWSQMLSVLCKQLAVSLFKNVQD